ncbi:MAG: TerC/Alx family metal homeostasis membrane protein [Herbinix sp.]|nr:TerC/Alx family metal homeostasis membrane protein [Herbinix sp.]
MSTRKAFTRLILWVDLALCIALGILIFVGREEALEFLGGYIIEQSLSIDNLFIFILIFSSFGLKLEYQRRVLKYGIAGAFILRLIFIVLGVAIVNMFHWVLYVFGVVLIISGIKMLFHQNESVKINDNKIIKLLCKIIPFTDKYERDKFFIRKDKHLYATPLFAILVVVEATDLLMAIDSIPAIFSITTNPYIVYLSNILAIIGLRNLYFVLRRLHEKFRCVKYGVAIILTFTGVKLLALMFDYNIPTLWSLTIILSILVGCVIASVTSTLIWSNEQR